MDALKQSNQTTLGKSLADKIRNDIIDGVYLPNAKLPVSELGQRYQASPIPVREALTRLASAGFVRAEPQRGFRVTEISLEDLKDITQCRIFIEVEALQRSLKHGDLKWEANLVSAHHRLKRLRMLSGYQPSMDEAWEEAHIEFHRALLAGCDSGWLLYMTEIMRQQTSRYRHLSLYALTPEGEKNTGKGAVRDVAGEHKDLLEAALARDANTASELLTSHFQATCNLAIEILTSSHPLAKAHSVNGQT